MALRPALVALYSFRFFGVFDGVWVGVDPGMRDVIVGGSGRGTQPHAGCACCASARTLSIHPSTERKPSVGSSLDGARLCRGLRHRGIWRAGNRLSCIWRLGGGVGDWRFGGAVDRHNDSSN